MARPRSGTLSWDRIGELLLEYVFGPGGRTATAAVGRGGSPAAPTSDPPATLRRVALAQALDGCPHLQTAAERWLLVSELDRLEDAVKTVERELAWARHRCKHGEAHALDRRHKALLGRRRRTKRRERKLARSAEYNEAMGYLARSMYRRGLR